ncbi:MAG: EAL domain-containing protein [Bradyrhizobium sp.]|nr:MAG: EAL domain-containing protein [Bradyrhizobium sp.]
MANETRDDAPRPDDGALLRGALTALPIAVEVRSAAGARVYANAAADAAPDPSRRRDSVKRAGRLELVEAGDFQLAGQTYRVSAAIDIDEERRLQEDLYQRAYVDPLTGLPSRAFFDEAVTRSLGGAAAQAHFALAAIGVDQFDSINEFYGRPVGDALLREAARRLNEAIGGDDVLARFGGDRFAVLIASPGDGPAALAGVERLIACFRNPFYVDGVEILLSASAGVSVFPLHDAKAEGLIAKAETALTQAKRRYRGQARLYDPATAKQAQERARLEQNLRLAVRDHHFACALQPKVNFRTGKLAGLEVLMRWRDENGEARSPGDSIAFAVNVGLMNEMTMLLFEETIASLDAIDATFAPGLRLGFNIAAQQAGDMRFMRSFADRLAASGHAQRFMIELTEEALLRASQFQLQVAPMLREIGAKISIDDFGVGYSSLSTLAEITADEIKVDRSFITAIHERPRNQDLLRAIESVGEALHTPVIVEGVETESELDYLRDNTRISVAQGYFFSPPVVIGRTTNLDAALTPAHTEGRADTQNRVIERRGPRA